MTDQSRAVIWDLDGTLIDSTDYHWITWRDAMAAEGIDLTYEQFVSNFGKRNDTILRGYLGDDLPLSEIARIGDGKEQRYRELVRSHGIELLPGARHWLTVLHAEGWQQAVATSAPRANLDTIIEALALAELFGATVSADDVERGKPDPQPFLLAAGLEGAQRAGMHTIAVQTTHHDLSADYVAARLDTLPANIFAQLVQLPV
jgi:beta-phosphoglucomutase